MNATRALQTSFQAVLLARRQIDITVQYIRPFFSLNSIPSDKFCLIMMLRRLADSEGFLRGLHSKVSK
jgi:hypothetical protein